MGDSVLWEETSVERALVKVYGAAVSGIEACKVTIEAQISSGTKFMLVGLPDAAVK